MEFLEGFRWAVSAAFTDSVSLCRFQIGDTLYDSTKAYEEQWGDARKHIEYSVQVRNSQAMGVSVDIESTDVFTRNWNSEVHLDLWRKGALVGERTIQSTQGRLFTLLWKGDVEVLDLTTEAPAAPLTLKDVTRLLPDHRKVLQDRSKGYATFALPYDRTNAISRAKYAKVVKALREIIIEPTFMLTTREAGLPTWESMVPTIRIVLFRFDPSALGEVENSLKGALYRRDESKKKEMYRVGAHGVLLSPGNSSPPGNVTL